MKDIRPAIRALLLSDATVSGLVDGERVFPSIPPQGEKRASVVYHAITELQDYAMRGPQRLFNAQFQIDSWANNPDDAATLANAAHDVLAGFTGEVAFGSNSPQDFVTIQGIFLASGREGYENEPQMYRMSRDYYFWYLDS